MPLDPNISLSTQPIATAAPVEQLAQNVGQQRMQTYEIGRQQYMDKQQVLNDQSQRAFQGAETLKAQYEGMDMKQKLRARNAITLAALVQPHVASGDLEGAQNIIDRAGQGDDMFAQDSTAMSDLIKKGDIKGLQQHLTGLTGAGQVLGVLPQDVTFGQFQNMGPQGQQDYQKYKMAGYAGRSAAMAELAMMNNDPSYANVPLAQKLQFVNRKYGENLTMNSDGSISPITGAVGAEGALAGAKDQAKQGVDYATKLAADADAALKAKQSLVEMGQLAQNFTPGALAPMKQKLGEWMISVGMNPDDVNKSLGSVGDMQAMSKLTAQLATNSMKAFTSKGTQMEFKTFLQNNPNAALTPQGFQTVLGFMQKVNDVPLQKQAAFGKWSEGKSPTEFQNFDGQWNSQLNAGYDQQKADTGAPGTGTSGTGNLPAGVDQRLWEHMTPEERRLFQ